MSFFLFLPFPAYNLQHFLRKPILSVPREYPLTDWLQPVLEVHFLIGLCTHLPRSLRIRC